MAAVRVERWGKMNEPEMRWSAYPEIDFQISYYYARPKSMIEDGPNLWTMDPSCVATYEKLGIPLKEADDPAGCRGG